MHAAHTIQVKELGAVYSSKMTSVACPVCGKPAVLFASEKAGSYSKRDRYAHEMTMSNRGKGVVVEYGKSCLGEIYDSRGPKRK